MDPVYTDEKLGVFLKNVVQNRIFSIFLNFPKYCFFFGFWKLIFNILEISEKKHPKPQDSSGFSKTSRPVRGDRAPIGPMYPLELYTKGKSNTRRASRREGLAEFRPSATGIRGSDLKISSKSSDPDFLSVCANPRKFHMKLRHAVILRTVAY